MTTFALASELHRLTSDQRDQIDHIIADDGAWSPEQIRAYISRWRDACVLPERIPDNWIEPEPIA